MLFERESKQFNCYLLHFSGFPVEQYYDLTLLQKSHLRRNDEL